MTISRLGSMLLVSVIAVGATATQAQAPADALAVLKSSFKPRGQATLSRLDQDEAQALCSRPDSRGSLSPEAARRIQDANLAAVKYPADGKYMGDWRQGERIAQSGVGKQFSDDPARPAGGNCYACHQLAPHELSFGTIGPSLYQYGKQRGDSAGMQKYVFGRIFNPQGFIPCSSMPRFGHNGILTEEQITHLVALLLDPASPVNR
jgi:L-cysteine S-thiosulfotransferase